MCICMYVYMYICMCVCMNVYMYECKNACMYICLCVCMLHAVSHRTQHKLVVQGPLFLGWEILGS